MNYINTRDYSADIAGDVAPEGMAFVSAEHSPTGNALLLVANEVSGTLPVYQLTSSTATITFNAGSDTASADSAETGTDGKLTSLPTATRSGYNFKGWYLADGTQVTVDTVFTEATEVIASWSKKSTSSPSSSSSSSTSTDNEESETEDTTEDIADTIENSNSFADVDSDSYYYDAIQWAVEKEITSGTGDDTFSPNSAASRGQIVTFLYRAAGEPEVAGTASFSDVDADSYYYAAMLWAVENGITTGTGDGTFSPDMICTRGQIVTFLYRAAGEPEVAGEMPFTDVDADAYYYNAVLWAMDNGVTSGTGDDTFSPDDNCTRGQIVTFLYRFMGE